MDENTRALREWYIARYKASYEVGTWPCHECGRSIDPAHWQVEERQRAVGVCRWFHKHPGLAGVAQQRRLGLIGGESDGGGSLTPLSWLRWAYGD